MFMTSVLLAALTLSPVSVELSGKWTLDYWPQPDRGAVRTLAIPEHNTVEATVPGNCELDLVRAGVLPELEKGMNVLKAVPYEGYQWLYTRTFSAKACSGEHGERATLVFEGIDTLADIFLNGEKLGESANMLIARRFDVTGKLREGENMVQVLIRSIRCEAQYQTVGELGHSMGGGADGEPFRKAGHMGGWDIFPQLYCAGLWRGVRLEYESPVRIDQPAWVVKSLRKDSAELMATCRVQAPFRTLGHSRIRFTVAKDGKVVGAGEQPLDRYQNRQQLAVKGIERWWPKGMGAQPLYTAKIEIVADGGKVLAENAVKIGFRTIRLDRDDIYGKERPGQFRFIVNGEPCYVRGSNWVPLDSLHGRDREHMLTTLEMFNDLNCNMVRVWGGGVYEPDEFFDYCDEHGIMVWQDFMTGCSIFPQNDEYARATEEEIREIVLKYRNRASLALWSGNNENDGAFTWQLGRELGKHRDPNHERNSRRTIADVLWEFDVTRDYLPSSPYLSPDVHAGKAVASENHLWGARGYYKVPFYTNAPCYFASEMGYHGAPNRASLERMMSPDKVYPWTKVTGKDPQRDYHWNDEWKLKASDPRVGDFGFRRNSLMTNQLKLMFGDVPTELDDFIFGSQIVQAEAMKTFAELFRADKFTRKNGLIWWNVRDGWPQISDAVVDWYGGKKRAYFALKNAQYDQLVCVTDDGRVSAVNDTLKPVKGKVRITDRESGKVVFEGDYEVPANAAKVVGRITWSGHGVLDIAYEQGGEKHANWFLYGEAPFDFKKVKEWFK